MIHKLTCRLACWWLGHEWLPQKCYEDCQLKSYYFCKRCQQQISRDEYDHWERKI